MMKTRWLKADLHCHSTVSDGSLTPAQLVECARRAGLDCIGATDHDCLDGGRRAAEYARKNCPGFRVIDGVELSTFDYQAGKKVHLLCYHPARTEALEQICRHTREERVRVAEQMLARISMRYPVDLETVRGFAPDSSTVFKQHIALALMQMGYDTALFGELYHSLFSHKDGWAAIEPQYPETREVLPVAKASGGVCVLAHPGVYGDFGLLPALCERGLDGIEVQHSRQSADDCRTAARLAEQYGLLPTGGSDFHGAFTTHFNPIGSRIAPPGTAEKMIAALKLSF